MKIRDAESSDVESMVRLSETFRKSLSTYSPIFWRMAEDSFKNQTSFFSSLLSLEGTIVIVAERDSELAGFIIGRLQEAPPVYDPGGPVFLIDDFCIDADAEWRTVAPQLLEAVEQRARALGAVLSVVICPRRGAAKRRFLDDLGFEATSAWHIRGL